MTQKRSTGEDYSIVLVLLIGVLAFGFQGTRGVWEPDEGYYIGIARNMVETGDWIVPQLNLRPFLDKPPVVYWGSGLAMKFFGFNEWAARLPHALWFLLTTFLVGKIGQTLWDRPTGRLAALIYATSPIPFAAAYIVTPDTPLAFWLTASMYCFWMAYRAQSLFSEVFWKTLLGISLGVSVLCKGPATLVFMAPMLLFLLSTRRLITFCVRWSSILMLFFFFTLGASWYVAVNHYLPGAWAYFFDNEVYGRLVSKKYNRNPEWYAFATIYFPTLLFGTLPWSVAWYPQIYKKWNETNGGFWRGLGRGNEKILLFFWISIPFLVFCCASSRLPLYILPLFVPLSIISARCWMTWKPTLLSGRNKVNVLIPVGVWCLLLLVAKACMAYFPTERDTRLLWRGLKDYLPDATYELVVVNGRRHGLSFYSQGNVEWVTTNDDPYPLFYVQENLEEELHELSTSTHSHVFIVRERDYESVSNLLENLGHTFADHEGPSGTHVLVCPPAPQDDWVVRLAAMGDTRTGDSGQVQLGSALYQTDMTRPLDGIILLGDNLSFYGESKYIVEHFEMPYAALLENGVNFFAVLGNHDVKSGQVGFHLNYPHFNMNGRRFYTRAFGDNLVQCFFLDSNTVWGDRRQLAWLKRELGTSSALWKVVAMHHPIYGRTSRRPVLDENYRKLLEPIFIGGGVDIVLAGHNHVYQRLRPRENIHHFTAGSGGELERGVLLPDDPDLIVGNDQTNVALILQFTYEQCAFRAINSLEEVVDEGIISKDIPL